MRIRLKTDMGLRLKTDLPLLWISGEVAQPLGTSGLSIFGGPGGGRPLTFARGGETGGSFSTRMGGLVVTMSCKTPGTCQS